ncbi:efflux RND transporter permease subunit [Stella sp.]|uniref:efflux RND transporter permease subunit n=1 Tax=Stella sp. TaxID=2912054 RepID=UPI0035AEA59F
MVLSDVSIKRPVFATVLSLLLVVLGLAAFLRLQVREYPDIDPPIVSISTTYTGASAEVVENQVTEPLESAVAGIEAIKTINSVSRDERSEITIEFQLGRDIESAANDVRDKVARALDDLPETVKTPIIAKVDADARAIIWVAVVSERRTALELTDFIDRQLKDRFSLIEGVASVIISGERRYAMRIWLSREEMAARGITVPDIEGALRKQNVELPSGRLESRSRELTVRTDARLATPETFAAIILKTDAYGYQVRLGEVARVERGAEDERGQFRVDGRTAVGIGIVRQSKGNTIAVAEGVKAEVARLAGNIPDDIRLVIGYDESVFIDQSIHEVFHALTVAVVLVVVVIFLFLRSWRATIIPAVAIPVSVTATFIVLGALGFSINVLTLLALVLTIGLVVDDAIVVLENIDRRIDEGEPPLLAAYRGARQIAFAVIATTLVLVAVFVPISFMSGTTGRLFTEFGIALAASVIFSGFVALSLTPMMCSKLLQAKHSHGRLFRWSQAFFDGLNAGYRWLLARALAAPLVVLALGLVVSAAAYGLYQALPKEFAPIEDRGLALIPITAPEGSTLAYTANETAKVEDIVRPYIEGGEARTVFSIVAPGLARPAPVNRSLVIVRFKPWKERARKQQAIVQEIFPKLLAVPGIRAFAVNPPSLGQRGYQPPVQVVIGGSDYATVKEWSDRLIERLSTNPRLLNLDTDYRLSRPELRVHVDRPRAAALGVPIEDIGRSLQTMLGSREVTTYVDRSREYKVMVQARVEDRVRPADLATIFVRSATTQELIPLSNLTTLSEVAGPPQLTRMDRLPSITISASLPPGYALGDALADVERVIAEVLPPLARIGYKGSSLEYKEASSSVYITFLLALLIVFLVLAAQFESYIHPLIIMLAVPLAVTGGLGALLLTGQSLNIYSQIGMILLIGLMAKNGILIVEFANQLRDEGMSIHDAVLKASVVRLRPILMTSIATIFGAVPLADATGAGAEARSALGWVVIGGMAVATVMTLFLIPALYLLLARFTKTTGAIARELGRLDRDVRDVDLAHRPAPAE